MSGDFEFFCNIHIAKYFFLVILGLTSREIAQQVGSQSCNLVALDMNRILLQTVTTIILAMKRISAMPLSRPEHAALTPMPGSAGDIVRPAVLTVSS